MIIQTAKDYLAATNNIKVAHLIEIELAGTDNVFDYLTDYRGDIEFDSKVYAAGKVKNVSSVRLTKGVTNYKLDVTVAAEFQEELDKATTDESYEGRRLNVYRAFLDEAGEIIEIDSSTGGPFILFQGTITNINLKDAVTSGSSSVVWSCKGLLHDFEKVNGRITDDSSHRALESSGELGTLVPGSGAKREEYKTDTGFQHSNQTVAASLSYLTTETEYYFKKKWHGLSGDLRQREVEVTREIELSTSLSPKYLPAIYGVRQVSGIPVFLDANLNDPSTVYVVYAVCEGEIQSFLNVYVDGVSAICAPGGNTAADGVCMGNTANGDTISYYKSSSVEMERENNWTINPEAHKKGWYGWVDPVLVYPRPPQLPSTQVDRTQGTSHGEVYTIAAEGGPIQLTVYHGTATQEPDALLSTLAAEGKFLLQNKLRKPDGSTWGPEYWGYAGTGVSGAALLDTAYVVAEFQIGDDRSSIPELEFVVEGRKCRVYTDAITYTVEHTLNPVWHLLDYLTNDIFGGGLDYADFDLPSLISVAAQLDVEDLSYEAAYVKMWRYIGWKDTTGPRSKIQCNTYIDTALAVTKNVEEIISHFEGTVLPYSGNYHLSLENEDPVVATIPIEDVIGGVRLVNKANKDKWNAIQASIQDPALNWTSNQVSFFNSEYLAEDKGIRKQGRAAFTNITNYYTARAKAEHLLDESRFSKKVMITTYYKHFYLKPNDNVKFTFERYGYIEGNNSFRVSEIELRADGLIDLVLERFGTYSPTNQESVNPPIGDPTPRVPSPVNLTYANLPNGSIPLRGPEGEMAAVLFWDVPAGFDVLRYEVNIDDFIFQVSPNQRIEIFGEEKMYFLVTGLTPSTSNTYKVTRVNLKGQKSAYSIVVGTSSAGVAAYVPPIENLKLVNSDFRGNFIGKDAIFSWDSYSAQNSNITGIQIEVLTSDMNTTIHSEILPTSAVGYTFTYILNKQNYAILTGNTGAYRSITFRVRAISGDLQGESNVSLWRTL